MERSGPRPPSDSTDLALRDDLTGAWNRRYLRRLLGEDWAQLVAYQKTVTLLVLDLDLFKEINDTHGHLAGDHVLQQATDQLRASFRGDDRLIRYGGDEFVVALFGVGADEARTLAERARAALATVDITAAEDGPTITLPLSFSMGIASYPADGLTGEEILAVADRRLYEEKRARRPPAAGDRARRGWIVASALALAVALFAGWIEWRRVRTAPPVPLAEEAAAAAAAPLSEIVVRDEEELVRLREEVRRLQVELAEPRPRDDRERYEARIHELEARLAEAGDEAAPVDTTPASDASGAGQGSAVESTTGMQIGERRTRENLDLQPQASPAPSEGEIVASAGEAAAADPADASAGGVAPKVEPPQLLRAVRPDYPPLARARRRMGTVELLIRIDAAGKVVGVTPVGPPLGFGLDESARAAAMSAQFRPGRRDGVAVEMETRLAIRFLLEGPPR